MREGDAMTKKMTGQIVTIAFEDGKSRLDCGLEDCECPEHEGRIAPAGTYVTVRLDEDHRIGLTRATVEVYDD